MSFFVFYGHCYDLWGLEEFKTAEKAAERVVQIQQCGCDNPCIEVIEGKRKKIKTVEVITKIEFEDDV